MEGGSNVRVVQEEWFPVLHEMTLEEFHRLAREDDGAGVVDSDCLETVLGLFREATGKRGDALDALRTMPEAGTQNTLIPDFLKG